MDSRQPTVRPLRWLASHERRAAATFVPTGGDCFFVVVADWNTAGLLAGVFEMAREILVGGGGGVAVGVAADGAWILCAGGAGSARFFGTNVAGAVRARLGIYIWWFGYCFD